MQFRFNIFSGFFNQRRLREQIGAESMEATHDHVASNNAPTVANAATDISLLETNIQLPIVTLTATRSGLLSQYQKGNQE